MKATAATGTCADKGGVTIAVDGHAGDQVVKYNNGTTATTTSDGNGYITIVTTGTVAAPEYITLTATKATCKFDLPQGSTLFGTGRIPVAQGYSNTWVREMANQ